ncbi:Transmembrane channel-like protein 7 [Armadillidium vulgare]|nr:Transmembrane channel-like protein 7 [Armadillidium vulgare]
MLFHFREWKACLSCDLYSESSKQREVLVVGALLSLVVREAGALQVKAVLVEGILNLLQRRKQDGKMLVLSFIEKHIQELLENLYDNNIRTLLPSRKYSVGTLGRNSARRRSTTRNARRRRQSSAATTLVHTTRRGSDTYLEVLPDLTQGVDEEETWEKLQEIRMHTVPMREKREMKRQLLSAPTLRTRGFAAIKLSRRKFTSRIKMQLKEFVSKIGLWKGSLKYVEGNFGTGLVAFFTFIKWLLFLNIFSSALIILFIIVPQVLFTQPEDWCNNTTKRSVSLLPFFPQFSSELPSVEIVEPSSTPFITLPSDYNVKNNDNTRRRTISPRTPAVTIPTTTSTATSATTTTTTRRTTTTATTSTTSTTTTTATTVISTTTPSPPPLTQRHTTPRRTSTSVATFTSLPHLPKEDYEDEILPFSSYDYSLPSLPHTSEPNLPHTSNPPVASFSPFFAALYAYDNQSNECCFEQYKESIQVTEINHPYLIQSLQILLDCVQGTGILEISPLFYGYYPRLFLTIKEAFNFEYSLPLAYLFTMVFILTLSLVLMVRKAARGLRDRLRSSEGQFYQFSNMVFGGWDYCIENNKAANIKKKAIYNELKNFIETEKYKEEKEMRTKRERCRLYFVRLLINLIVLLILIGSFVAIYQATTFAFTRLTQLKESDYTVESDSKEEKGDDESPWWMTLLLEFLPSGTIVTLNIFIPSLFKFLVYYEKYTPNFILTLTLMRTIFLRLASLVVLLFTVYQRIRGCESPYDGKCVSSNSGCSEQIRCWETYVGQQLYKLTLLDLLIMAANTFLVNMPRKIVGHKFLRGTRIGEAIGGIEFEIPKHVLDIVYGQTLCWLGMFFSPLLPAVTCIKLDSPQWLQSFLFFLGTAGFAVPTIILLILVGYYYYAVAGANKHMVSLLKHQLVLEGHDKQFLLMRLDKIIKRTQELEELQRSERSSDFASEFAGMAGNNDLTLDIRGTN